MCTCGFNTDAFDDEQIDVTATAGGLTAATLAGATEALLTVETAGVRIRLTGDTATTTVGHLLDPGDTMMLRGTDAISKASLVRATGTSGVVTVTYFK